MPIYRSTYQTFFLSNARRVSVIGNFNHWDGRVTPMRSRGSGGIWEIFMPDLVPGGAWFTDMMSARPELSKPMIGLIMLGAMLSALMHTLP